MYAEWDGGMEMSVQDGACRKRMGGGGTHLHKLITPKTFRGISSCLQYHRVHNQDSPPSPSPTGSESTPSSMRADGLYNFMTDAGIHKGMMGHFNTEAPPIPPYLH